MGIVSEDVFVEAVRRSPTAALQAVRILAYSNAHPPHAAAMADRATALRVYGQIKDYITTNGYLPGKYLRPWELDNQLYARLDRTKPWWGFEFETGYKSREDRAAVINHVWDTWNNVVFDSEGEGNAAVEITFAPQESEKFHDGTADAFKFVEYLTNNPRVMQGNGAAVGTHLNFSHPNLTTNNYGRVAQGLQRTVAVLPKNCAEGDTRLHMFGRAALYGGFFCNAAEESCWIEGKLFRTTYDIEVFKRYLKVSEGLTKCLAILCNTATMGGEIPYVTNLYDVTFSDAQPAIAFAAAMEIDGTRGNGLLNGPLAMDVNPTGAVLLAHIEEDDDEDEEYDEREGTEDEDGNVWCADCRAYH